MLAYLINDMHSELELPYIIGLSFFEGIGPLRFRALIKYFGTARAVFESSETELKNTAVGNAVVDQFILFRKTTDINKLYESYLKKNIKIITLFDPEYPEKLKNLNDSPFVLYALGNSKLLHEELSLAVVGTRKPTSYGIEVTKMITKGLVEAGFVIVSGMAMGIDAVGHKTALDNKGKTIAVLGCGIDICYPAVNREIYTRIISDGLVVSEFPPGKLASKRVFPSRNRIIAGLSMGVLVTEGAEKSGSLITPRYAVEYGRDVFTVPGPITSPMNKASMILLRNGAKAVASADDILEEYLQAVSKQKRKERIKEVKNLSKAEQIIVNLIEERGSVHIDEMVRISDIQKTDLYAILSTLELKNIIKELDGGIYFLT
jgi:DNA processing protein